MAMRPQALRQEKVCGCSDGVGMPVYIDGIESSQ